MGIAHVMLLCPALLLVSSGIRAEPQPPPVPDHLALAQFRRDRDASERAVVPRAPPGERWRPQRLGGPALERVEPRDIKGRTGARTIGRRFGLGPDQEPRLAPERLVPPDARSFRYPWRSDRYQRALPHEPQRRYWRERRRPPSSLEAGARPRSLSL